MRVKLKIPILFLLLSTNTLATEEIKVERVSSRLVGNSYYLDAQINFEFHDDVLDALNNGVDLNIDIIIKVKVKRKWLWDSLYKRDIIKFKLDYKPLSNVYVVTNPGNLDRRQFDSIENALKYLGMVDNYFLLNNENLNDEQNLTGLLKAKLNVENLPPPLKPIAFISKRWKSDSQWHQWAIR